MSRDVYFPNDRILLYQQDMANNLVFNTFYQVTVPLKIINTLCQCYLKQQLFCNFVMLDKVIISYTLSFFMHMTPTSIYTVRVLLSLYYINKLCSSANN